MTMEKQVLIGALVDLLASNDAAKRSDARTQLIRIGKPAVDSLVGLLNVPQSHVRWEAAKSLAGIAEASSAAALVESLGDEDFGVRWVAAEALVKIGNSSLKPLLEKLFEAEHPEWFFDGAHHVLRDLALREHKQILAPVLAAFQSSEAEATVPVAAGKALEALRRS